MYKQSTKELLAFIANSTDCYHAVSTIQAMLNAAGYTELRECEKWEIKNGGKYYVIRNLSSIIAFEIPSSEYKGFMIASSHSDSPTYKIKPLPEVNNGMYTRLSVEAYGGMIASTWLDRPLGVSGRVVVKSENGVKTKLVKIDEDLLLIPNLAIHLNRDVNSGYAFNPAVDMLPLAGIGSEQGRFMAKISDAAQVNTDDILGYDLFLYNRTKGCIWGLNEEFFSSPRIDDLQCAYATLMGFISSSSSNSVKMYCVFDNEEVGSGTKQGAKSTFLTDTVQRINSGLGYDCEKLNRALASSFMVSADNGHAVHPNLPEKSDKTCRPVPNGGVVIKHNANQKYTTDSVSDGIFRRICEKAGVPVQVYTNRSDIPGGSTLGNLANEKLSMNTVDIGLAQLAMHSSYETGGTKDTLHLINASKEFFSSTIKAISADEYVLE